MAKTNAGAPSKKPGAKTVTAAPPRVTIVLKMAMSFASAPGVVRWNEGKGIRGATVSVQGTSITGTTDINGRVKLAIVGVATRRVLDVQPAAGQVSSGQAGTGHGGGGASAPTLQLRPFQVTIDTDAKGFVPGTAKLTLTGAATDPAYALLLSVSAKDLALDWKPDFLKSGNVNKIAGKTNEVLVLHQTGGATIRSAINSFLNPKENKCIHYLVDRDGHVVKLAHESDGVNHTGPAFWLGKTGVNARSVGIEHVNQPSTAYTPEQYTTTLRLVQDIRSVHGIARQSVVGHMEVATEASNKNGNDQTLSSRRIDDPGQLFEWERFEGASQARTRGTLVPLPTVFGIGPGQSAQRFKATKKIALIPKTLSPNFAAIQTTLAAIGYSVAANGTTISGVFDDQLTAAVNAFQRRYFSGANASLRSAAFRLGRIDFETALAIQMVSQDTGP